METETDEIKEPQHVCISIPHEPEYNSTVIKRPPPLALSTPSHGPTSCTYPHTNTMKRHPRYSSSAYPRAAESDSEVNSSDDSSNKIQDEEDPLYSLDTPPSHTPSPHSHSPSFTLSHTPSYDSHTSHTPSSHSHTPFFIPSVLPPSPPSPPKLSRQASVAEDLLCTICTSVLHNPMSLHCGHTFCQLCLAAMWQNSREPIAAISLNCPVCRSSWRNFPGVNIQLRNIIERTYPERCSERTLALMPEDHELLAKFKRARDKETQLKDKAAPELRREEMRRLVTVLCCAFGIVIALLLLIFSLILWAWTGAEGEFMRKPASQWSQTDVAEWVDGLGNWASKNYTQLFLGEHITGQRLLHLDEMALEAIGIKDEYRRQSILYGIQELRNDDYNTPRNFKEFKASHRRQTLLVAVFYSLWPRLTLVYVYTFNYYDMFLPFMRYHFPTREVPDVGTGEKMEHIPGVEEEVGTEWGEGEKYRKKDGVVLTEPTYQELVAMFIEIILIPHFLVAYFAWEWAGIHPWIAYPVIVHCLWCMWTEGKVVIGWLTSGALTNWYREGGGENWRTKLLQAIKMFLKWSLKRCLFFIVLVVIATILWHIVPHFICDLLFYYLVWQTALNAVFWIPLRHALRFIGGHNFRAQIQMNIRRPVARQQVENA